MTRVARRPERGFTLDVAETCRAIGPDTRLVALARPHNPTGERVPDADLVALAERAAEVGAWVLVDEVFADATPEGDRPARLLHDRILSVNSVTKCLGYGRLHVGWLVAHEDARDALDRAKAHVTAMNPPLATLAASRVLDARFNILDRTRSARAANVAALSRFVASRRDLSWVAPEAGTTAVARLPPRFADDRAFAARLLAKESVLVAPGSAIELSGWIRVGLVGPTHVFSGGLERLGTFLG